VDSTAQEMSEAMRSMVESMQTRVSEESRMLSDMEERASQDNNFAKIENADRWNTLEVCYWLNNIHLQKYVNNFNTLSIDGSILLNDLNETILANDLGIKNIHLKKCSREIVKLQEAVASKEKATETEKARRIEELEKQVSSLRQANLKLKESVDAFKEQSKQPSEVRSPRSQLRQQKDVDVGNESVVAQITKQ